MDEEEVKKQFEKEINDKICPECHIGILYPRLDIPNYLKCCICGFARFAKNDKKIERKDIG